MAAAPSEKRQRKPLTIVNPETKTAVDVAGGLSLPAAPAPTPTSETRPVESSTSDSGSSSVPPVKVAETNSKVQDDFRRQVAEKIGKSNDETSSAALAAKSAASRGKSPTPVASSTSKESTTSQSSSSEPPSHAYPGIRTVNIPEEKVETKVDLEQSSKATVNILPSGQLGAFLFVFLPSCRHAVSACRFILCNRQRARETERGREK